MASSTLADIRKEVLTFSFNIWIQPKEMPSDSNTTSSNCLAGKQSLGSQQNRISAFSCFLLGHKRSKEGPFAEDFAQCAGSSSLCANEKYFSTYSISTFSPQI